MLPIVKLHFLIRYETTLIRDASVKYLFPRSLDVQNIDVEEKPTRVQVLNLNTNLIIS